MNFHMSNREQCRRHVSIIVAISHVRLQSSHEISLDMLSRLHGVI